MIFLARTAEILMKIGKPVALGCRPAAGPLDGLNRRLKGGSRQVHSVQLGAGHLVLWRRASLLPLYLFSTYSRPSNNTRLALQGLGFRDCEGLLRSASP
jgi:hypothetical protein